MWQLLEQAAKSATANASEYVSTVQVKAQSIVATVQDEAATLLHALGTARTGPVDEILYEEIEDYKAFVDGFKVDAHTDEITQVLETDDEMHALHEQMVPLQLSYDEFWSRFFFREHQTHEATRREHERREQQAASAAAAAADSDRLVLNDDDDGDDLAADGSANDLAQSLDDGASAVGANDVSLVPVAHDADRRAARAWRAKANELEQQVRALSAQLATATERVATDKDAELQQLCDAYEAKMADVTLAIDDARALGYDAGIRESETIVTAMRADADAEIAALKQQLASSDNSNDSSSSSSSNKTAAELQQANAALQQELDAARAQVRALEARPSAASPAEPPKQNASDSSTRELELWRLRAIKMKKAKEAVDAEIATLQHALAAAQQAEAAALTQQQAAATAHALRVAELEAAAAQAYQSGYDAASLAAQRDIELLRAEIAVLRARSTASATAAGTDAETEPDVIWSVPVPVLGDEFSDTDAMSHSIDNLHSAAASDTDGRNNDSYGDDGDSETGDTGSASVSDNAPRDDWGEW